VDYVTTRTYALAIDQRARPAFYWSFVKNWAMSVQFSPVTSPCTRI